jgi:tetratricopeptide (TPR) repeat protein
MNKILLIFIVAIFINQNSFAQDVPAFPKAETAKSKLEKPEDDKIALEYFRNKEYDKAVELYEKLFEEKQTRFFYTYYMHCLIELQDYKKALKIIKGQQKKEPDALRFMVDEGFIYTLEGQNQKATKLFDEALKKLTGDRMQVNDLANAYNNRGQSEYAIEAYLKGRRLNSEYNFNLELARVYERMERYSEMVNEYLDLLDSDLSRMEFISGRLQSALEKDKENVVDETIRTELLKRVQRYPDKVHFSEMLIWHSMQQKDFDMALIQSKSLDRRFNEEGARLLDLASVCISNEAYDVAVEAYEYVVAKGKTNAFYLDGRIGLLNARYMKITNRFDYTLQDLHDLENEYNKALAEFGENSSTVPIMKYLAHLQAFYLDNINDAINILNKAIQMPNASPKLIAECKLELGDIKLFAGDHWDATLLYSQVDYDFKNDPIGSEAKYKNARLSYYIGEFGWARAQLDVLKAATSKLIANDAMKLSLLISDNIDMDSTYTALQYYAKADLLVYRNNFDRALATLDSIQMVALWHPLHDDVLFKRAEIMLARGNYQVADSLLAKVTEVYPEEVIADKALITRARLNDQKFRNTEMAMTLYNQLLFDYPGSIYVTEARKRFRELRGDMIN